MDETTLFNYEDQENNDVITLRIKDLIQKDKRWIKVLSLFRFICSTPDTLCNYTEEQKIEYKKCIEYPDRKDIDTIEYDDHFNEDKDNPIKDAIPDGKGWICQDKYVNINYISGHDFVFNSLMESLSKIMDSPVESRGLYYYPPGAYHKWHSNQYEPHGWRIYIVGVPKGGESYFCYIGKDDNKLYKKRDEDAIINIFKVGSEKNTGLLYHSVASITAHRWSFGILVDDAKLDSFLKNISL